MKRATAKDVLRSRGYDISIHALVKRATLVTAERDVQVFISIHALVKRATFDSRRCSR